MRQRLEVPVYYDFASSLCYVAHRAALRLAPDLETIGVGLRWTPLHLSFLLGIQVGAELLPARRENARRVAAELGVSVEVPTHWLDSRPVLEAALLADDADACTQNGIGATWRELVWSEIFEAKRPPPKREQVILLAREVGLEIDDASLERAGQRLETQTSDAAHAMVTGVPTFMLGEWPFGGIQQDETMRAVLRRFVARRGEGRM